MHLSLELADITRFETLNLLLQSLEHKFNELKCRLIILELYLQKKKEKERKRQINMIDRMKPNHLNERSATVKKEGDAAFKYLEIFGYFVDGRRSEWQIVIPFTLSDESGQSPLNIVKLRLKTLFVPHRPIQLNHFNSILTGNKRWFDFLQILQN